MVSVDAEFQGQVVWLQSPSSDPPSFADLMLSCPACVVSIPYLIESALNEITSWFGLQKKKKKKEERKENKMEKNVTQRFVCVAGFIKVWEDVWSAAALQQSQ